MRFDGFAVGVFGGLEFSSCVVRLGVAWISPYWNVDSCDGGSRRSFEVKKEGCAICAFCIWLLFR